ncbi:MAG: hypothetical protein JXR97_14510 [Planctomycetes bacterium]|nr:hypothetical protein [Planctomycetota bacterium]
MVKRILGGLLALWGIAIIANKLMGNNPESGNEAYAAGQIVGLILGGLFIIVGLYYAVKGGKKQELETKE